MDSGLADMLNSANAAMLGALVSGRRFWVHWPVADVTVRVRDKKGNHVEVPVLDQLFDFHPQPRTCNGEVLGPALYSGGGGDPPSDCVSVWRGVMKQGATGVNSLLSFVRENKKAEHLRTFTQSGLTGEVKAQTN